MSSDQEKSEIELRIKEEIVKENVEKIVSSTGVDVIITDEQNKLTTQIYNLSKIAVQSFINDMSLNNTIKITKMMCQLIKQLETVQINGKSPSGKDKKIVAIQIGRILIKDITPDDNYETEILTLYDLIAEPTLEAMIEVSKVVNVGNIVQKITTSCGPNLFKLFKH